MKDDTTRIEVGGDRPYPVLIGRDLTGHLPSLLGGSTRVAVVSAPPLAPVADQIATVLHGDGFTVTTLTVPDAEAGKRIDVAAHCWDALGAAGFTRTDAIVGVGGGAVTDLAGFVAATWLRGVPWVPVSTSLLGMVDAAVGGKTAVNIDSGKNLVGAFHPPVGVLCDLSMLDTLPTRDLTAGLAEVVKCGFIADPRILTLVESDPAAARRPDSPVVRELVERAIRVKATVVGADLRETGLREILNYGHTLAHAIERVENYTWRHGDAVAVGLVYAAAVGLALGLLDEATAIRHRTVLTSLGLPVTYRAEAWPMLAPTMRLDKKTRGDRLRLVLLGGIARPRVVDNVDERTLADAYREVVA